jgi:hypothetical protein
MKMWHTTSCPMFDLLYNTWQFVGCKRQYKSMFDCCQIVRSLFSNVAVIKATSKLIGNHLPFLDWSDVLLDLKVGLAFSWILTFWMVLQPMEILEKTVHFFLCLYSLKCIWKQSFFEGLFWKMTKNVFVYSLSQLEHFMLGRNQGIKCSQKMLQAW